MASAQGKPLEDIVPAEALAWYLESLDDQGFAEESQRMEQARRDLTGDSAAQTGDDDFDREDARIVAELAKKARAKGRARP